MKINYLIAWDCWGLPIDIFSGKYDFDILNVPRDSRNSNRHCTSMVIVKSSKEPYTWSHLKIEEGGRRVRIWKYICILRITYISVEPWWCSWKSSGAPTSNPRVEWPKMSRGARRAVFMPDVVVTFLFENKRKNIYHLASLCCTNRE